MSADEHIDRIPQTFNLQDPDEVDALLEGAPVALDLSDAQGEWMYERWCKQLDLFL